MRNMPDPSRAATEVPTANMSQSVILPLTANQREKGERERETEAQEEDISSKVLACSSH